MDTRYEMQTLRAHDLSIAMKTSSGDTIAMDFANHTSSTFSHETDANTSSTFMQFSSMQSFSFKVQSNGISAQDQKEIDAFMKTAQPYIDSFLEELHAEAPTSPVTKLAEKITSIFESDRVRDENHSKHAKAGIVASFDNALKDFVEKNKALPSNEILKPSEILEKIFQDTQKFLEKTLKEFDAIHTHMYA